MKTSSALAVLTALALFGCGGDDDGSSGTGGTAGSGGSAAGAGGSSGSTAGTGGGAGASGSGGAGGAVTPIGDLPAGWSTFEPGGDTTCSRGTPFRYFVRPGTVDRVVVDFRGGGACWNDVTCSFAGSIFEEEANPDFFIAGDDGAGIYDHGDDRNPFKDWHHVYIPYCTGDVHWGNATRTYGTGAEAFTIHHRGAVNVQAALDWLYASLPSPEKVFVTGCSAGAYGSVLWSAYLREHYSDATVYQFADSGAGVITQEFFNESFPQWNAYDAIPSFIPNVDPMSLSRLPQIYSVIGGHFPDMLVSQYNTVYDDNQHFYYEAMGGGDAHEWSAAMRMNIEDTAATTSTFRYFLAPGFQHCIIPYPNFYDVESDGTKLVDWLNDVVNDRVVSNVDCGTDCGAPKM